MMWFSVFLKRVMYVMYDEMNIAQKDGTSFYWDWGEV